MFMFFRYKKREGGKLVRGYSETDLKAILVSAVNFISSFSMSYVCGGEDNGVESRHNTLLWPTLKDIGAEYNE